ncbi:MAG: aspartate/glutamate racemase family protein [Alphaproteobacteria bacterium]
MDLHAPATKPTLGLMQLANAPITLPASMGNPDSYSYPARFLQVPGAWGERIVGDDMSMVDAYVACARRLENEGVAALATNCGFTARFQKAVAGAVRIPVALSSLLLVPLMAGFLPPGRKLGVLTASARHLNEVHFAGAGWSAKDYAIAMAGIEDSQSMCEMMKAEPRLTTAMIERDVIAAARALLAREPRIGLLVLECSAFPVAAVAVRRETGLPAVDFVTLCNLIMAGAGARRAGRERAPGAAGEALAILRLQHRPVELPGAISRPDSFAYPVRYHAVPGAWADNVTAGDRSVLPAYIGSARAMEREGADAITTTCGFTALFQRDIAAAVSVPFAGSSLLLVPFVKRILPPGAKLAILTFDSTRLSEAHAEAAGFTLADDSIVVDGVEGTESWSEMMKPEPGITHDMLARDVIAAGRRLIERHPQVRAIVHECAVFPIVTDAVRRTLRLPVFDYLALADVLMDSVRGRRAAAARAPAVEAAAE